MLVEPHPTRVRYLFWLGRPLSGSGPRRQEVNATYPHQPPTSSDNEMTRAIAKRTVVERVRPCGVVIDLPSPARESSRELLEKLFSSSSAHTGHVAAARHVMQQMKTRDRAASERGAGVAAVVPAGAAVVGHPAGKPMGSPCATARVASPARQPTKPSPPNISERAIGLCPLNFVERAIGPWLHNYLRHPNPASRKMFGNPFSESSEGSTVMIPMRLCKHRAARPSVSKETPPPRTSRSPVRDVVFHRPRGPPSQCNPQMERCLLYR